MGWFNEQILERRKNDNEALESAFVDVVSAVLGDKAATAARDERFVIKSAIDEVLRYYHVPSGEVPGDIRDRDGQLEYLLRPWGIMRRRVELTEGWYKNCVGALLGTRADNGSTVALIPNKFFGYSFLDTDTGKRVKLNRETAKLIEPEALCFYKPFPLRKIDLKDLFAYMMQTIPTGSLVMVVLATLAVTGLGLILPKINYIIFSDVITSHSAQLLLSLLAFYLCVGISTVMMDAVKALVSSRVSTQLDLNVEAATMSRMLSLPASFFVQYSAGQLSYKMQYMNSLCSMLFSAIYSTSLTSLLSLVYVAQIFKYAPALVAPALIITAVTFVFSILTTLRQMGITRQCMALAGRERGMTYSLISGVQKIKLAGAEKRMFSRWLGLYAEEARLSYNPPMFLRLNKVISSAISLVGTIVMYYAAVQSGVSVAEYTAFSAAYGMISGAFMGLAGIASTVAQIHPILDEVKPIMDAEPEASEGKKMVTRVSGGIELTNVSFRYADSMPLVIDNLSLNIRPGQYIALVGSTGCGKSTLVRLLLGFEKPQKGAIYYDRRDLSTLDLKSLRSKIGCVMQNGKLFFGDIFSNITVSAPWLTLDDAWEAAEVAGIADDIRAMPMGMHTVIAEGQGGISGGQKQRLMIARAVAPKPKILILDEATSALDNVTQKKVSEALDGLKCTRIVIAHRLSTIRQCDRIIVLDQGKIVEDGTYEELIAENGYFAELVARQRLDAGEIKSEQADPAAEGKKFEEMFTVT